MIKDLKPRLYQQTILAACISNNTLVVLPTGMGKTAIAVLLAAHRLINFPNSKILLLAPTKPLAQQHLATFKKYFELPEEDLVLFTGEVKPEKREQQWKNAKIVFSTPQSVENDLITGKINLEYVSLLVFDEAHRATGEYAYNFIAKKYTEKAKFPRILGLTASPGSDMEKITEVCQNIFIENVEVRTEKDPDVKPYVKEIKIKWVEVELPQELLAIKKYIEACIKRKTEDLKQYISDQVNAAKIMTATKKELLGIQAELHSKLRTGERDFGTMKAISILAEIMKAQHALELVETQGIAALQKYFEKLWEESKTTKTKALKNLVQDANFKSAFMSCNKSYEVKIEHPKLFELKKIIEQELKKNAETKIIIFTQYRDTAVRIKQEIETVNNAKTEIFVGQAKKNDTGLSQKKQKEMLDRFSKGEINTLISTSLHPYEFIILKSPENKIIISKIGEFVNSFLNGLQIKDKRSVSRSIRGWQALSHDGISVNFHPITQVHKHLRQSNVVKIRLASGFESLITEDHSIFTFNQDGAEVATTPELNKFVSMAFSAPNPTNNLKIDIIAELLKYAPKEVLDKIYCTFEGLSQAKIRILKTNLKVLSVMKNRSFSKSKISLKSHTDLTTVTHVTKRLEQEKYICLVRNGREVNCSLTNSGKKYLKYLEWFFRNYYYWKKKYRIPINSLKHAPESEYMNNLNVEVLYGKIKTNRYININVDLAEFLGYYVSEGSSKNTKISSNVHLAAQKEDMQKRMKNSVDKGLKLPCHVTWRGVTINSQIAHLLIKYVFRCGIGSHNKEVPDLLFSATTKAKWKFLEAYSKGDGYFGKTGLILTTVSRKLAFGLVFLLRQVGVKKITIKKDHCYRICIYEKLPFFNFQDSDGKRNYYSTIPTASINKKAFFRYKNFYSYEPSSYIKVRVKKKPQDHVCFDYINSIEKLSVQPDFVYDIGIKKTEKFFGGVGLLCLHNSVGEEGLDIPKVDSVIFYEPIPSAIRQIQRRGRTGRLEEGSVIVLVTRNTRDVGYKWSAHYKEKRMHKTLDEIKDKLTLTKKSIYQPRLDEFSAAKKTEPKIKIFADYREKASNVMKELIEQGILLNLQQLKTGDYILSERIGIEFKTVPDFVDSIVDGRLLQQIKELKEEFEKPILIIEGTEDIYAQRQVHPNAIRGMIATITIDYGIPIIKTENYKETAAYLIAIAKREQEDGKKEYSLHAGKPITLKEQQEYIVSALPGVGPSIAKPLLKKFGSVQKIMNAEEKELCEVENLGKIKAKRIREVLDKEYET